MKTLKSNTSLIAIITCSSLLSFNSLASDLTYSDDSYASGDTLTASDLNTKFNSIKSSVNDNNSSIQTNASSISSNTTEINNLKNKSGVVSLPPQAFQAYDSANSCYWRAEAGSAQAWLNAGSHADCNMAAAIQIPDGVTLKKLTCNIHDLTDKAEITASLYQHNIITGGAREIFQTASSGMTQADGRMSLVDTSLASNTFSAINDNSTYSYHIALKTTQTATPANPTNIILYSCHVAYE